LVSFDTKNTEPLLNNCCICFATDAGYLFPALLSAIQARTHSSRSVADVVIYYFAAEPRAEEDFGNICMRENIGFIRVGLDVIEQSQTPYARLFLDRFVPAHYTQLLYVDSDTQIVGSLDPLIRADVPVGHFLAAADCVAFLTDEVARRSRWMRGYLDRIGCQNSDNYFNSGVLRINRNGWTAVASQAHAFCRSLPSEFNRFWDQDGLNAVAGSARLPMSLKWNFPIFMRNCRVEEQVKPIVYHFSSSPKPWNGNFPPWNQRATLPYVELIQQYPELAQYMPSFSRIRKMKYFLQQRMKRCHETLAWGLSSRRKRILEYESLAAVRQLCSEKRATPTEPI